jgi:AraC family transcriptional regulator, regulatory protein of adaptative response / methylated-DNA-[protein]-cysteine methyltransferase
MAGKSMPSPDLCWEAVQKRDQAQDGRFYFGVMTTGVYCRPSCAARRPLRKNVRFYERPEQAEKDGLRPCLRCRPLAAAGADPYTQRIRDLCRYIDAHSDERLQLHDLAERVDLSPFHLQRSFKAITGLTPREYLEAARLRLLKSGLRRSGGVTKAVYDAGYNSSSCVYERADTRLGMTPNQYRRGGDGIVITYALADTRIGMMMIGATDRGICSIQFGDSRAELLAELEREYPQATIELMRRTGDHPTFQRWISALNDHLAGRQPRIDLPLDIRATAFQMLVWNYLQSIPYGNVKSYGEVAKAIGRPKAVRAVARACASNRVAIVIPCHRVICGTGELGGYRWGLARKRMLLAI